MDRLLNKLTPRRHSAASSREEDTDRVVLEAEAARVSSRQAMYDAYRKAGVVFEGPHRRHDD